MQRTIRTPEGDIMHLQETTRLGHDIQDKEDPQAHDKIMVLHNMDGPALIKADGKKEYYFYGIYQGTSSDVLKELKRTNTGLPPAKNPLFKSRM